MGGLSDFIFGKESEVQQTSTPNLTPEQMALLKKLIGQIGGNPDLAGNAQGVTPYDKPIVGDVSNLERTSLAALEELAMKSAVGGDSTLNAARGAVERGAKADVNLDEFNTYFKGAVADPALREFTEGVIPELTRRFSGNAAFGSDRRTAELDATGRFGDSLATSRADSFFKYLNDTRNRSLAAAQLAPGVAGAETGILSQLLAAGGVGREAGDRKSLAEYNEFIRQQEGKGAAFAQALALLGIKPIDNATVVKPGSEGFLTALASGAGKAMGAKFLG